MPPALMKCHYEVLEVGRDVDEAVLKKQYRKMALKYHPDKNPDDPEGAKQTFQIIQQAYDVLSDPQERAWYDNHREEILKGGLGEKMEDDGLELFQYFSSSCYSGFGDDEDGFYGVYNEVFKTLAKEDFDFIDDEESDFEIPEFGKSVDEYEDVCAAFYNYWSGYSTPRTYSWLDKYDTRQAENRWMRRKMEQENKIVTDKAKKERNEVVRNLVAFVRKRDKRVAAYRKKLEEKSEENKKKTKEFQKKQREERKKLFDSVGDASGFGMSEMEAELKQLEGQYSDSEDISEEEDLSGEEIDELISELDDLYCVACDKTFKTYGAKDNHETSKKHKDNIDKLIQEMKDDEEKEELNGEEELDEKDSLSNCDGSSNKSVVSGNSESENSSLKIKSKKKKKGNGLRKPIIELSSDEEEKGNEFLKNLSESSEEDKFSKKKKKKGKDKKKSIKTETIKAEEHINLNSVENTEAVINGEDVLAVNPRIEKVIDNKEDSHTQPVPDNGRLKGKNIKKLSRSDKTEEKENVLITLINSSDEDTLSKKRKKGKDKKRLPKTKETIHVNSSFKENTEDINVKSGDVSEEEGGHVESHSQLENNVDKEDSHTRPVPDEGRSKGKKNKKPSKSGKSEEVDPDLNRGDLNCAQCKSTFPSKNKLYNHLKTTGHAVYLPGGGEPEPSPSSKSKKKKGKN